MKPDYNGGSIVNMMSSIAASFGCKTGYPYLDKLHPEDLEDAENIILILVDGMGFEYVKSRSTFVDNMMGSMTSLFPSTTAACIPMFATGEAPQQHGITGWFMHIKELGTVGLPLPFTNRLGMGLEEKVELETLFDQKPLCSKIKCNSYVIIKNELAGSSFQKAYYKDATILGFSGIDAFFGKIGKAVRKKGRKYIYAYWSNFDSISHEYGVNSRQAFNHFRKFESKLTSFIRSMKGTKSIIIVTADHGIIDTRKEKVIRLSHHPAMAECLTIPLCGEPRMAYCYVKPSKSMQFKKYVATQLKKSCKLHVSEDLIRQNYFGTGKPHKFLKERIGDYVLEMKDDYIIIDDTFANDEFSFHIGNHGGTSKDEMLVPLFVFHCY